MRQKGLWGESNSRSDIPVLLQSDIPRAGHSECSSDRMTHKQTLWTAIATTSSLVLILSGTALAQPPKAEVSGNVENLSGSCPSLNFVIGGIRITTDPKTDFDDGACEELKNGARAEVEGTLREDGTLVASEVDLK